MKKVLSVILAVVLTFSIAAAFSACSNKEQAEEIIIAIPNDTTNEARALLLLQDQGLLTLNDGVGITDMEFTKDIIGAEKIEELNRIKAGIIDGSIQVTDTFNQ